MPKMAIKFVDKIAVFPDFSPRAISRTLQNEITGLKIRAYVVNPPIKAQVPNSSCDNCLVTISVNTSPVNILTIPITNEIIPE